ncbi:uncharacterized protein BJX67DRAFT_13162 [Aspergillus lucknowensis]|uniref:Uncharacterized protein n=1 Tax=Aspergillus lucknowensis TaxID=176173 RepID=A0ABR4M7K5_9EURO
MVFQHRHGTCTRSALFASSVTADCSFFQPRFEQHLLTLHWLYLWGCRSAIFFTMSPPGQGLALTAAPLALKNTSDRQSLPPFPVSKIIPPRGLITTMSRCCLSNRWHPSRCGRDRPCHAVPATKLPGPREGGVSPSWKLPSPAMFWKSERSSPSQSAATALGNKLRTLSLPFLSRDCSKVPIPQKHGGFRFRPSLSCNSNPGHRARGRPDFSPEDGQRNASRASGVESACQAVPKMMRSCEAIHPQSRRSPTIGCPRSKCPPRPWLPSERNSLAVLKLHQSHGWLSSSSTDKNTVHDPQHDNSSAQLKLQLSPTS